MKTRKEDKKKNGALSFRVKMYHDFIEPYSYDEDYDNLVRRKSYDEYVVYDEKTFYDVLDEFLDAPKKKLKSCLKNVTPLKPNSSMNLKPKLTTL